jgi:hypothetical protein
MRLSYFEKVLGIESGKRALLGSIAAQRPSCQ